MAAGVDLGAVQARPAEHLGGLADGLHLGVAGRVLGTVDLVDGTGDHLPLMDQHGAEGAATGLDIGAGKLKGLAHESICGHETVLRC